ncbi:MAG: hypothetical protein PVF58_01810 [Candidatus Methanofastidiosia archaeon]|jgi:hypothetical protein
MADKKSINTLNNQLNENKAASDESDILNMELHPNARDRIKEHVDYFSKLLLIQATSSTICRREYLRWENCLPLLCKCETVKKGYPFRVNPLKK